LVLEGSLLTFK